MTGLKSGSGDDLWGDESDETDRTDENDADTESKAESATDANQSTSSEKNKQTEKSSDGSTTNTVSKDDSSSSTSSSPSISHESASQQPYIVRRAVQDKSVQFERDERLTFFVHDDVVDGERDLITDVESELGRSVPKFDVREAVYRAALRNRNDILEELLKMGYSDDGSS